MADREPFDPAVHHAAVLLERERRNERLRDPMSWLTLVGLHWLRPGAMSFGAADGNDIVLRAEDGEVPAIAGTLEVADGRVRLHPADEAMITVAGEPVPEGLELVDDREGEPTIMELASLRLHVIHRGVDRHALRVRDTHAPTLRAFHGVAAFEPDPAWRFVGRLVPAPAGATIRVADVVGDVTDETTPGDVELVIDGTTHRLHALDAGNRLWLVFGDRTNGGETYGGGRFLVTGEVQPDGRVEVDFNLAYNPPCVFSPYATCPMVPEGNTLPLRVEAGERVEAATHQE